MNRFFKFFSVNMFLLIVFFLVLIIAFPKDRVYNSCIKFASSKDIQIIPKSKNISILNIGLNDIKIYLSSADIAKVSSIDIGLLSTTIDNIWFLGTFKNILPKIETIKINYIIGDFIVISGNFGKVIGDLDILHNKIILIANIKQSVFNKYKNIFSMFKKSKNKKERYIYEFTF